MSKRMWRGPLTRKNKIRQHRQIAMQGVKAIAQQYQAKMETYAKQNRQWKDRTGNARAGLHGWIEEKGDTVRVFISHGVDYGENLETINNGAYAIIGETLEYHAPGIMDDLRVFFKR